LKKLKPEKKDKELMVEIKDNNNKEEKAVLFSLEIFHSVLLNNLYKKLLKNMEILLESELLKIKKETAEDLVILIFHLLKKLMLHWLLQELQLMADN